MTDQPPGEATTSSAGAGPAGSLPPVPPRFSWFHPLQAADASLLAVRVSAAAASRVTETAGLSAALSVLEQERVGADPELVRQGFALFVTHNDRGRRLVKPRSVQAAPDLFLAPEVRRVGRELSIGGLSPTLDYWREDMLANEHHQHWHEVYPWVGRPPESFEHWVHEVSDADKATLLGVIAPGVDWPSRLAGATPTQVAGMFAGALDGVGRQRIITAVFADPPSLTRALFRELFRLNDRHGELFLYMHRQMLARYDAELLSHGLPQVKAFTPQQWRKPVPEGYDPEGLQNQRGVPFTVRRQNRTVDPRYVTVLEQLDAQVQTALESRLVPGADASIPDRPIAASPFGEFIEEGLHNTGHGALGSLSEPIPAGQLGAGDPNGVMNNPLGAIRDQVFWRWHKLIDDFGNAWENTLDPEGFTDGPPALIRAGLTASPAPWSSPDIILVRASDLPDQSEAQLRQLGERLFGGAQWDTDFTKAPAESGSVSLVTTDELVTVISTATLGNGRTIKFLNHEPFSCYIRVENPSDQPVALTVRIFLVPEAYETDRRAWIELDKFSASLAAEQKAVVYRPDSQSAVIKRPAEHSPTDIADRPGGRTSYCDCGWPYTLLLPRGDHDGLPCRLLVMLTDASIDNMSQPGECGSMSFCGARDRYPDNREMGYPFARPFAGPATAIRDTFLSLPNAAGRSVTIRHSG
jgi:hypothetical protein